MREINILRKKSAGRRLGPSHSGGKEQVEAGGGRCGDWWLYGVLYVSQGLVGWRWDKIENKWVVSRQN